MKKTKENKHLYIIMKEMCKRVKAPYKVVNSTPDWYLKYSWSEKKQNNFRDWLAEYLYSNKEAREELMAFPRLKTKKHLREVANFFIFNYGWKTKN